MSTLFQEYLLGVEDSMQTLSENAYQGAVRRAWWPLIMKHRETMGGRTFLNWLLSTARIHDAGQGGRMTFESMAHAFTEIEVRTGESGLSITRSQLEDSMAGDEGREGVNVALAWAEQIGAAIAYWPQKHAAQILRRGHLAASAGGFDAYDGKPFFATDHPVNPYDDRVGTYSNIIAGKPIDASVGFGEALDNWGEVLAHIGAIKMPHGEDFRCLRPRAILAPPKLMPRAQRISGLSAVPPVAPDATMVEVADAVNVAGFTLPVHCSELSGFEDETTYFVACEQVDSSELGALVYLEREPFEITYYGPEGSAELSRRDTLEWHVNGRNRIAAGHPFLLFKVTAAPAAG